MSNFTVNGVYNYTTANIYSYLGRVPANERTLGDAFDKFNVTPTGEARTDLEKLDKAMYAEYSEQVQNQIENQNREKVVPWASLCAQIGIQATGNHEKDYAAFTNAINLLCQSAIDGQAMAYFAGLKSEASRVFNLATPENEQRMTFDAYKRIYLL